MSNRINFSKTDIGGEILPILTTGLYRDTLDALREYIQNSIDAWASDIELVIDPDTVSVSDDGIGMTLAQARNALRLGISDKNPTENIGFRGIGIYSAYNLCELLEIYTKAKGASKTYRLTFNFSSIRKQLMVEQERRKKDLPPKLYLEKLLETTVYVVEETGEHELSSHGTRVILSGILGDAYNRLLDWESVVSYLQDVVPLPFHPDFRFAKVIENKFKDEDYRVVPLTLQINTRREAIYRPYTNELFAKGGLHRPKFFTLTKGKTRFGFAWVCINDERRVLKDLALRGLLIKKFGFSIATRSYLEHFFARTVFNRRITGEIIIQHPDLLPNAGRSDFENNSTREEFLEMLPLFIAHLSGWADKLQLEDKAREVLEEADESLGRINAGLVSNRRDKDKMLEYNVKLADLERRLKAHKKTLDSPELRQEHQRVLELLKEGKAFVRNALTNTTAAYKRLEKDVVKAIQAEVERPEPAFQPEEPLSLVSVLDGAGLQIPDDLRRVLMLFESECLKNHLDTSTYGAALKEFKEILEEEA